ncbi:mCG66375 [Mus musculus]|nr:mCG66375 [Mus musculus]
MGRWFSAANYLRSFSRLHSEPARFAKPELEECSLIQLHEGEQVIFPPMETGDSVMHQLSNELPSLEFLGNVPCSFN